VQWRTRDCNISNHKIIKIAIPQGITLWCSLYDEISSKCFKQNYYYYRAHEDLCTTPQRPVNRQSGGPHIITWRGSNLDLRPLVGQPCFKRLQVEVVFKVFKNDNLATLYASYTFIHQVSNSGFIRLATYHVGENRHHQW